MAKSYGWGGKILWVDLTDGTCRTEPTEYYAPQNFIGGYGLSTKIFWDLGSPKVAAFDPGNPLIFSVGPLTGTPGPFGRGEVAGIAPQCHPVELFSYSGFGGIWPTELKWAGYDAIVVLGKADRPVYLSVHDEVAEIEDASELWGLDTFETQRVLTSSDPEAAVLCIGPAGEKALRVGCITGETGSAAGQGGFGGVMGSKNLKAIRVKGTGMVNIAKPDLFLSLMSDAKKFPDWWSPPGITTGIHSVWRDPAKTEMTRKYLKKRSGCFLCAYPCQPYYDAPGIGVGYLECAEAWYGLIDIADSKGQLAGHFFFQKAGINNFEAGVGLFAFLGKAFALGVLAPKDVDFPVPKVMGGTVTAPESIEALSKAIVEKKTIWADGVARGAERLGKAAWAVYETIGQARGFTAHYYDTIGGAFDWALDTRDVYDVGHFYSNFASAVVAGKDIGPAIAANFGVPGGPTVKVYPDKAAAVYEGQERTAVWGRNHHQLINSLTMCNYRSQARHLFNPPTMDIEIMQSRLFSAATGVDMDVKGLQKAGERIDNLDRAIKVRREDRTRKDDTLYAPWFSEGGQMMLGVFALGAKNLDLAKFEALKDRYYALRGWDVATGRPKRAKLAELGLTDVADTLDKEGKLPK